MDLRAKDGKIIDASAFARLVETPDAIVTPEGTINVTANPEIAEKSSRNNKPISIVIPYRENDPLFQSSGFTWIIEAKFKGLSDLPKKVN